MIEVTFIVLLIDTLTILVMFSLKEGRRKEFRRKEAWKEARRRKGVLIVHSFFFCLKNELIDTHIDHTCDISI